MNTISVQTVQTALEQAGFTSLVPHLNVITRPSIRVHSTPESPATTSTPAPSTGYTAGQPGMSRLGGLPDLPPGVEWPVWQGVPQSFVGQIRLEDVQAYDTEKALPASGLLSFFYNAKQDTYGDAPTDAGSWSVLFTSDTTKLKPAASPANLPAESQFKVSALTFSSQLTLSPQPQLEVPGLPWTDADQQKYDPIYAQFTNDPKDTSPRDQLLGHPLTLQDDMRLQCEINSRGLTENTDSPELAKRALRWHLLFQVDSDERIGMKWGSAGLIYYWITSEDLRAHRFDHTWLVLQSD